MAAVKTLPTDVSKVGAEGTVKLFGRWETQDVECKDISLTDYIQIRHAVYLPHTAGRYAKKQFRKAQMPIVERLVDSLMMKGRNNGKKLMAVRIVAHAFEIIHLLTDQNPIQVLVDAIVNTGPREDSTRIGSQGTVRRQAVDVSPLRRVNQAVALLTIGTRESAFRNVKSVAECLADELINAAKGSSNSYAIKGVRIKARKGAVKAQAKHEPSVFRDQLYKHLEPVQSGDFEGYTKELVAAGGTLEYLKYADALFEILIVGGLLQPGGSFVDDGAPKSPFSIANVPEPIQVDEVKKYVEVFNKLIRRYKYLQRPLEESSLPSLMQYMHRWPPEQKDKVAVATGLMISQGLASAGCLQTLTKDSIVKDGAALNIVTSVFRVILAEQTMEHLSSLLKKGGIKDLLLFFPLSKRTADALLTHFKDANLSQIADWYTKKQTSALKTQLIAQLKQMCENEEPPETIIAAIREHQAALPEAELVQVIWQGLMASVDWSARADQIEGLALREVTKYAPIIEPFCNTGKSQVALINVVQVYCYDDTRIIKAFPQILKVLYNKDCVSDQAIIYWFQKGAKPQGKQHFLKASEPLVKFLQSQEDESDDDEE
ncbi:40S ribosomal protein S5 [Rhizoctonia solani AG-1 IB]|uniref:40S ribosomal protein S5 n=1 Tax=Thanatephorus cucumeris (strain AG1-IB / isolate 7/3/14) TaxID=1108050 RepID=M5BJ11_THACB|nr:40S ribosomal protein S5 [Rhizoctonia solani AG-1 IB]